MLYTWNLYIIVVSYTFQNRKKKNSVRVQDTNFTPNLSLAPDLTFLYLITQMS